MKGSFMFKLKSWIYIFFLTASFCLDQDAFSQDNYEIQVYGSETVAKQATMFELHSNYTFDGSVAVSNKVLPTNHTFHETVEITHGFNDWFEVGFYLFNAIGSNNRTNYVGSHIRPRVRVPDTWHWPVGVSLSTEAGFQKLQYSEDDWSLEIRPIVDKSLNKIYLAFNPTVEKSLHGPNTREGFIFSPNIKTSYDVTPKWALGFEYYGSIGQLTHFSPLKQQQHQVFLAADANLSPDWELNFGYGHAFTKNADNSILKLIVGYRLHKKSKEISKNASTEDK